MNVTKTISGLAAVLLAAASTHAAVLVSADFNAPTYADGALVSSTDTTNPGQDGWLNSSGAGTANISVSNTATNGVASITANGQDVRKTATGFGINSGSATLTVDLTVSAATATGDYFIHMGDGGTGNFYGRTFAKSSGAGYVLAINTAAGTTPAPTYGSTVLDFGTTYTLTLQYDFVSGTANDTASLLINGNPYVSGTTIGTDATTIAGMYLRQSANTPVATFDNMRVEGTVVAVPEPASLALIGLGGLAALRRPSRLSPTRVRTEFSKRAGRNSTGPLCVARARMTSSSVSQPI